jgi:DNA-binding response OmpR family regulator
MKILLLEDELMLQSSIEEYLISLGHIVRSYNNGIQAKKVLETESFDLLILDINVPEINGFKILEILNFKKLYTPTIFITALVDIEDITKAYNLGASDYLKKPFHLKELNFRIDQIANQIQNHKRHHIVLSENYTYSKEKDILYYQAKVEPLTKKQSLIIKSLCLNINMVVSFENLRESVWEYQSISDATIRAEISRLRRSLKEDFIQNIKGVGYRVSRFSKLY